MSVPEALRVRARLEVEFFDEDLLESRTHIASETVNRHQTIEALDAGKVRLVNMHAGVREEAISRNMVFMTVTMMTASIDTGAPPWATTETEGSMSTVSLDPLTRSAFPEG